MRLVIDRRRSPDGYFRVDLSDVAETRCFSKKLQKTLPAKVVDYLGLASSPIYYDIEPPVIIGSPHPNEYVRIS